MKKYLIFLMACVGILMLPHFSFAAQSLIITPSNTGALSTLSFQTIYGFGGWTALYNASGNVIATTTWASNSTNAWPAFSGSTNALSDGSYSMVLYASSAVPPACGSLGSTYASCVGYVVSNIGGVQPWGFGGTFAITISGGIANFTDTNYGNASPTIAFVFPVNGTSTPDFANWIVSAENLSATSTSAYQLNVKYSTPTGVNFFQDGRSCGSYDTSCDLVIPKSQILANLNAATTTWNATVFLYDQTAQQYVASSSIVFTILNNGTFVTNNTSSSFVTASSALNLFANPVQSVNTNCTAPSSTIFSDPATYTGQSLAFGLCTLSVYLFVPSTNIQAYMQNSVTNIENVMPFSLGYGILNAIQSVSGSSTVPVERDLTWQMNAGSAGTVPITMISSTTLTTAFGSSNKTLIFLWEDYIFYTMTLMAMFFSIYEFVHRIAGHRANKPTTKK